MTFSAEPPPDNAPSAESRQASAFANSLSALEDAVRLLRSQYEQQQRIQALQAKLEQTRQQHSSSPSAHQLAQTGLNSGTAAEINAGILPENPAEIPLETQLQQLEQQLETLELQLRSELFGWGDLKEWFWQVLRYGGLGLVMGWGLAFYWIKNPAPAPENPPLSSPAILEPRR
jgi:hypothetical protein